MCRGFSWGDKEGKGKVHLNYQLEDLMPTQAGGWTVTSQYLWYEQGFHNEARMGDNS